LERLKFWLVKRGIKIIAAIAAIVLSVPIVNITLKIGLSTTSLAGIIGTALIAFATFLLWAATGTMADNVIRPKLGCIQSSREERLANKRAVGTKLLERRGIRVENVGVGPAINGKLYRLKKQDIRLLTKVFGIRKNKKEFIGGFKRLPSSRAEAMWPYLYPSRNFEQLQIPGDEKEIDLRIDYFDINKKPYVDRFLITLKEEVIPKLEFSFEDGNKNTQIKLADYDVKLRIKNIGKKAINDLALTIFISPFVDVTSEEYPVSTETNKRYFHYNIAYVEIEELNAGKDMVSKSIHLTSKKAGKCQIFIHPGIPGIGELQREILSVDFNIGV